MEPLLQGRHAVAFFLFEKVLMGHGLHDPEEFKKLPRLQSENDKYFNINAALHK